MTKQSLILCKLAKKPFGSVLWKRKKEEKPATSQLQNNPKPPPLPLAFPYF